jgi:hypothetical protein
MKRRTIGLLGTLACAPLFLQAAPALAGSPPYTMTRDHRHHDDHRDHGRHGHEHRDRHCDHGRHYESRRVVVVDRLPRGYRDVNYHGAHYYHHNGYWYQPYGPRFVMVAPPAGLVIDSRGLSGFVAAEFPLVRW